MKFKFKEENTFGEFQGLFWWFIPATDHRLSSSRMFTIGQLTDSVTEDNNKGEPLG